MQKVIDEGLLKLMECIRGYPVINDRNMEKGTMSYKIALRQTTTTITITTK